MNIESEIELVFSTIFNDPEVKAAQEIVFHDEVFSSPKIEMMIKLALDKIKPPENNEEAKKLHSHCQELLKRANLHTFKKSQELMLCCISAVNQHKKFLWIWPNEHIRLISGVMIKILLDKQVIEYNQRVKTLYQFNQKNHGQPHSLANALHQQENENAKLLENNQTQQQIMIQQKTEIKTLENSVHELKEKNQKLTETVEELHIKNEVLTTENKKLKQKVVDAKITQYQLEIKRTDSQPYEANSPPLANYRP